MGFAFIALLCLFQLQHSAAEDEFIKCENNYMEICTPKHASEFYWNEGNADGALVGDRLDGCTSYEKLIGDTDYTCAITMYQQAEGSVPQTVDNISRYDCENKVEDEGDFITISNVLSMTQGGMTQGDVVKFTGRCSFNRRWVDQAITFDMPEIQTMFTDDRGQFNSDMKFCTSPACTSWFNIPAARSEVSDQYIMQITTPAANMFPRIRNCWASPTLPVRPDEGTPHPDQVQIVTEYCASNDSPLKSSTELSTPNGAMDDVRLLVPSFAFVGSVDVATGDALQYVYIMCDVTVALDSEIGTTGGDICHLVNSPARLLEENRRLEGEEKTTSVAGAFDASNATEKIESVQKSVGGTVDDLKDTVNNIVEDIKTELESGAYLCATAPVVLAAAALL